MVSLLVLFGLLRRNKFGGEIVHVNFVQRLFKDYRFGRFRPGGLGGRRLKMPMTEQTHIVEYQ